MESAHIAKLFSILEATAGKPEGRSLAELAADVGLAKSTTHRLLQSLCSLGYMTNCGGGVYRQTSLLRQLASGFQDEQLIRLAHPWMQDIRNATGETVNLGVMRMERVVYLHVLESMQPLRRMVEASMTDPALSTALGRAIVAFQSPERRQYVLRAVTIEKRTPHTVIEPDELEAILAQARHEGFAVEENQTDLGVTCVAAPIFDREAVVAAISVSAPLVRLSSDRRLQVIELVRDAARRIGTQLVHNQSGQLELSSGEIPRPQKSHSSESCVESTRSRPNRPTFTPNRSRSKRPETSAQEAPPDVIPVHRPC
jgi:DNA-binding IclR family transcriptional regulator